MAKKFSQRNIRKITRTGSSLTVSLPVEILAQLKWKEKQKVVIKKIRGGVTIKDWPASRRRATASRGGKK